MYECVIRWVKADLESRFQYLNDLLAHVRFPLMSDGYLKDIVLTESLIQESNLGLQSCLEAIECHSRPERRLNPIHCSTSQPRKSREVGLIYVISGGCFEWFDSITKTWHSKSSHWFDFAFGMVQFNKKMYTSFRQNIIAEMDPMTNKVKILSATNSRRGPPTRSICVLGNYIYFVGGLHDSTNFVERIDVDFKRWQNVTPMLQSRQQPGIVTLNGYIYVLGGTRGEEQKKTKTVS